VAARQLNADVSTIAFSGRGMYRNLDGSMTDTMPQLYERILTNVASPTWSFAEQPQAVVINLGTNDFGLGDPGAGFTAAYLEFVRAIRARYPNALIVCTIGPMLNDSYPAGEMRLTRQRTYVDSVVATRRGEGDGKVEFLEFPPQTASELGCDYHPDVGKHQTMGDALAALLRSKLGF
jgi:hypothetical protein